MSVGDWGPSLECDNEGVPAVVEESFLLPDTKLYRMRVRAACGGVGRVTHTRDSARARARARRRARARARDRPEAPPLGCGEEEKDEEEDLLTVYNK